MRIMYRSLDLFFKYSQSQKNATSCKVRNTHRFELDRLMVQKTHFLKTN